MNVLIVQHTRSEGPGWWGEFLDEVGASQTFAHPYNGDALNFQPRDFDWLLCLGGPMNVYQEDIYPWLREENIFLQNWLREGGAYLGVCLGAQLLAKAAGGRVVRSPQTEIGWGEVQLNPQGVSDPLFEGVAPQFPVLHWHGDMAQLPNDSALGNAAELAFSSGCPIQALRVGNKAYGLQFHVEVTPAMLAEWTAQAQDYLAQNPDAQPAFEMIAQARERQVEARKLSRRIFDNFCRIAMKSE